MAHPAEQLDLVGLEAHARSAPVPEPPPGELGCDVVDEDGETRGQTLDDDHQGRAVGFARGQEAQHDVPLRLNVRSNAGGRKRAYLMTSSPSQSLNGASPNRN